MLSVLLLLLLLLLVLLLSRLGLPGGLLLCHRLPLLLPLLRRVRQRRQAQTVQVLLSHCRADGGGVVLVER